jgi:hypothetical protein
VQSLIITSALALSLGGSAAALPGLQQTRGPTDRLLGSTRLTVLGLGIYDARLWAAAGFTAHDYAAHAFTLELAYLRNIEGKLIVERSIREMRGIEPLSEEQVRNWSAALARLIPDVRRGDRVTGIHSPRGGVRFLLNDTPLGEIADPDFARVFMGIWLSPRTTQPAMRQALLGGATS